MIHIDGEYLFEAPPDLVWRLLHEPAALQEAMPGCERLITEGASGALLTVRLPAGPLHGHYDGRVTVVEALEPQTVALALHGAGEGRSFGGDGRLTLSAEGGRTRLHYTGHVAVTDPLNRSSTRLLQTTANALVRQYLEGLDTQARRRQGLPILDGREEHDKQGRSASTIDMADWLAELRRDRQVMLAIALVAVLGVLSLVGAGFVAYLGGRWYSRRYERHLARLLEEEQARRADRTS